jgi:hypothetical protein
MSTRTLPLTSHMLLRVSVIGLAASLVACVLPSVTQQTDPAATAASGENQRTESTGSARVTPARDGGSDASQPLSMESPERADAGVSSAKSTSSAAGTNAASGGMSSMSTAARGGSAAVAGGRTADAPTAGAVASPKPGELGATCRTASECTSGHCADGVCCTARCGNECERCNAVGKCELIDGERDSNTCSESRDMCSRGVCLRSNGSTCETVFDCASGHCAGRFQVAPTVETPLGVCCAMNAGCQTCQCSMDGVSCVPLSGPVCDEGRVCVGGACMAR